MMLGSIGGTAILLLLTAVVGAVLWLILRRLPTPAPRPVGQFLPSPAPRASRTARTLEAFVLAMAATIIIAIAATDNSTGGYMLILDELRPEYAAVNIAMFVAVVAVTALAIGLTWLGRNRLGFTLLATGLTCYGLVLNAGRYPAQWFVPASFVEPYCHYTIQISGANVQGAELWVNGVYLGKMPYTTTLDEFEAKVPYWTEPPADYETDVENVYHYEWFGAFSRPMHRWIKLDFPRRPTTAERTQGTTLPSERKTYYARVRYAGQWGLATGGGGSGGGLSSGLVFHLSSYADVEFLDRQRRLETLLNKARLADYCVGEDWFKAIETYNEDGWFALVAAAEKDPLMAQVMDAWAAWRYGLDKVSDADSGWRAFERICDEADAQQQYLTASVAGRAVELLVPILPQERLLDRAIAWIRKANMFNYFWWRTNDRLEFGYTKRALGSMGSGGKVHFNFYGSGTGRGFLPASGFAVAHAVWKLNETLRTQGGVEPNAVRQNLAPEILCWQYQSLSDMPLRVIAYLGGAEVDRFLLRQNWGADPESLPRETSFFIGRGQVNKWLYLLAYLNDEAGSRFRSENADKIMALADARYEGPYYSSRLPDIDFIFSDTNMARQYWPRFAELTRQKAQDYALQQQWRYLLKMGAAATPDMFVEAWRSTEIDYMDSGNALELLYDLKPPLQQKVVDALVQEVREHPENIKEGGSNAPEKMISRLQEHALGSKMQAQAVGLFSTLQKDLNDDAGRLRKNVPLWLEHAQSDSPLVEMLAEAESPELRRMAIGALMALATPRHRELLGRLMQDADPAVQAAAREADAQLQTLARRNPADFASDAAATQRPTSTSSPAGEDQ